MTGPSPRDVIEHLASLERRLSAEHMDGIERWIRSEPLTGRSPPSGIHYWRFFAQLCGRIMQDRRRDDLDLATRAVLRGGAWVDNTARSRTWLYFSFVAFCARQLGLDPDQYLAGYAADLEPDMAGAITNVVPYLHNTAGPVDEQNRLHAPVLIGDSVDFEPVWDPEAHARAVESAERRLAMLARTADHYATTEGPQRAEAFVSSAQSPTLPWLPDGAPVYEDLDLLGPETRGLLLTAARGQRLDRTPPRTAVAEFVREQASLAARFGDEEALMAGLAAAAGLLPSLLGLPFRAADHLFGPDGPQRLNAATTRLPEDSAAAISTWADRPDRTTELGDYIETGVLAGLKFSRRYQAAR